MLLSISALIKHWSLAKSFVNLDKKQLEEGVCIKKTLGCQVKRDFDQQCSLKDALLEKLVKSGMN